MQSVSFHIFSHICRIYFVTYNVATKFPDPREDLHQLLDITPCNESKLWPDLYFIGYVIELFSTCVRFSDKLCTLLVYRKLNHNHKI